MHFRFSFWPLDSALTAQALGRKGRYTLWGVKRIREPEKMGRARRSSEAVVTRDEVGMEPLPGALGGGCVAASEVYVRGDYC